MTPTTIALSLAAVAILFVVAPFLRGKGKADREAARAAQGAAGGRGAGPVESALPDPLEELELERAMGKVSDDDYARARAAIDAQRRVREEAEGAPASPDDPAIVEAAEAMIREARASTVRCETCGPRPEPGARFCSRCGRATAA